MATLTDPNSSPGCVGRKHLASPFSITSRFSLDSDRSPTSSLNAASSSFEQICALSTCAYLRSLEGVAVPQPAASTAATVTMAIEKERIGEEVIKNSALMVPL